MRNSVPFVIAVILTACGAAVTTTNSEADAQARRSAKHRPDPNAGLQEARDMASWDEGGAPGCVNSSVTGRERAVAQRLGAGACANETPSAATRSNASAASWAGRYVGPFDGGQGEVVIAGPQSNRLYSVQMSVVGGGCSGQADGFNAPRGNVLTLNVQTGNQADGFGECAIALTRQGGTLRVSESGSCTDLHGMSCGFVGSATRR